MKLRLPRLRALAVLAAAILATGALGWYALPFAIPLPPSLSSGEEGSPVLLDRHGTPIHHLPLPDFTRSRPVSLSEIPSGLIACTLAAEDKRFYRHGGIDLLATARAAKDFITKKRVTSGASTITQQLVKISSPAAARRPLTKVREALAARRLEMSWSKERILITYLNRLDYGNLRTGSSEAARFYFQKPLNDLSLAECALLAGIPQAPSRLNPLRHPQRALNRRNTVLRRLAENPNYDASRISSAIREPLTLRPLRNETSAPWLPALPNPRSTLRTSLDLPLQQDLETIVREETAKLKHANLRHAAVVVIDNSNSEILALVSSASWDDPRGGQLNGATRPRSPGSTLKPFTYLLAMEKTPRSPASILSDIPTPFRTAQGLNLPENYDRKYRGPVTLRTALACSLNVPAMRELQNLGGPELLAAFLEQLGISTIRKSPEVYGLGLTLGNAPVNLLEITNAYATLARGGRHLPPSLTPVPDPPFPGPLFDPVHAYLISDILSDRKARAPSFPPGGPLDLPFRCAVKTGTSSNFTDNWCIGYTPAFTVGVWAGNFEHQPMKSISGIDGAGPIFHRSMLRLHRNLEPTWFERPAGILDVTVDSRNGKLTAPSTLGTLPSTQREMTPADRVPMPATSADYDATGKALLGPEYREWFSSTHNHRINEFVLDEGKPALEPLRIITPANGTTYLLDPEIPSGSDKLRPVTNLPGVAKWSSETLIVEAAEPEPIIHLKPGTHILTATDPRTGVTHRILLVVKKL